MCLTRSVTVTAATFLLLFALCLPTHAADSEAATWVDREHSRYIAEQHTLRQQEQAALQAQQQAETARQYAARINDQQAFPIAERAMATTERALKRIRQRLERTSARLSAVAKVHAAQAEGNLAVASNLQGTVEVKTASGWTTLSPDTILKPGQEIRTGADGSAEVMFNDGSRINLHAKSSFVLESEDDTMSSYRLTLGQIKAQINRLGRRHYKIRTPVASAAVRGTEFLLETTAEGASALVVLRGEVEFGPLDQNRHISVRQGERAILAADGALRGPEPFELKTLQPWWE